MGNTNNARTLRPVVLYLAGPATCKEGPIRSTVAPRLAGTQLRAVGLCCQKRSPVVHELRHCGSVQVFAALRWLPTVLLVGDAAQSVSFTRRRKKLDSKLLRASSRAQSRSVFAHLIAEGLVRAVVWFPA